MKRKLAFLLLLLLIVSSAACGMQDTGMFLEYEGKIKKLDAPTGSNSLFITLANGRTVYTVDETRVFDGEYPKWRALPRWNDFDLGDTVHVWTGKEASRDMLPVYYILRNEEVGAEQGYTGALYELATLEELSGGGCVFTDAKSGVRVTVEEEQIGDDTPAVGGLCFVWHKDGAKASDIRAEYAFFMPGLAGGK